MSSSTSAGISSSDVLRLQLIHAGVLAALARAGHGSKVLVAAANFPATTRRGSYTTVIDLALSPGVVSCPQVLEALVSAAAFERANVLQPPDTHTVEHGEPPAWGEYRRILDEQLALEPLDPPTFMSEVADDSLALTITTGDLRMYTSLLLTIGVVGTP